MNQTVRGEGEDGEGEGVEGTGRVGALVERLERCPGLISQLCGQGDVTTHFTEGSPIEGGREKERRRREGCC